MASASESRDGAVLFEGVWKKFRTGETHDSLRDLLPAFERGTHGLEGLRLPRRAPPAAPVGRVSGPPQEALRTRRTGPGPPRSAGPIAADAPRAGQGRRMRLGGHHGRRDTTVVTPGV